MYQHLITKERFKKGIILFWTLWWLIAFWTDLVGGLAHLGVLKQTWAPDTNFPFLVKAFAIYPVPLWVPQLAFIGILAWSLLSALAFCWASMSLHRGQSCWMHRADLAFIVSLSFWLAFFIADQLMMQYDLEENHMVQGGFQLLCYLSIYLLPNESRAD